MRTPHRWSALLCCLLFAACGGDDANEPQDTSPADTSVADTSVADTSAADTAQPPADTAQPPADTAQPPADTTPADTTPVDLGEGTCPGIIACSEACAGDGVCEAACAAAADNGDESAAFIALTACLGTSGCTTPDGTTSSERAYYQCQRGCLEELAVCKAGSFGAAACPATNGCVVNDCFEGDFMCERACMSGATQIAVEDLLDWNLCALSQCFNADDIIAQEGCMQQVRNEPACSDPYTQCFGDVGAAPGAGAGGGR